MTGQVSTSAGAPEQATGVAGGRWRRRSVLALAVTACGAHAFETPLQVPAKMSVLATRTPMLDVARAGNRMVAVGVRGHIVFSDDAGKSWHQAKVPVSVDLVAVSFPTDRLGWAVGHGGAVLHSADAGTTWVLQLDGPRAAKLAVDYYAARLQESPREEMKRAQAQAAALAADNSTQAFLDVYFENATDGFIVGTFNRIFRTSDGGKTWTPWMDRTGNNGELHFYSVNGQDGRVLLTGEQGRVWLLNHERTGFEARPTGYTGTLFGSVILKSGWLVFGMRGSLFRSADEGKTWSKVSVPAQGGISSGVRLGENQLLLATQGGTILRSDDAGLTFRTLKLTERPMSYFGLAAAADGAIVAVGSEGVRRNAVQAL